MDTRTGELYKMLPDGDIKPLSKEIIINELSELTPIEDKEDIKKHLIPVKRDLTEIEKSNAQVNLYSPCACGSGKKFKFCCHKKS